MSKHLLLLCSFIIMLSACSTLPQKPTGDVHAIKNWQIRGKVALISPEQKGSARLFWQQKGDNFEVVLTSTVGTHIFTLMRKDGKAQLIESNGQVSYSKDAESLLERKTQWYLPIKKLQTWIKGIPGDASHRLNKKNQMDSLVQGQWAVNFNRYKNFSGYMLPEIITVFGYENQMRILIYEWNPS